MKVKIRTTPLTQASTATAFKLATKSMSADEFSLSKEPCHLQFFTPKLQKAWAPPQDQIFHMVVRPYKPTGGKLRLAGFGDQCVVWIWGPIVGPRETWCEFWDQQQIGLRGPLLVLPPLVGEGYSDPSQIMTMDYKWLALAWSASSVMLLKLLKPKAFYGIRIHFTTYMFCNFWWNTKELYHHIFL